MTKRWRVITSEPLGESIGIQIIEGAPPEVDDEAICERSGCRFVVRGEDLISFSAYASGRRSIAVAPVPGPPNLTKGDILVVNPSEDDSRANQP